MVKHGGNMTDTNMNQNDEQLLEEGDETPQLESGDDLAQQALASANQTALPAAKITSQDPSALADTLLSLQNVIERNAIELDRIKEELKINRDSLKSIFENDTTLAEVEEKAAQVTQQVKERKAQIQSTLEVNQLKSEIGDLTSQKKEIEEALNNHLLNLYQITGSKTFDTSDGQQREFDIRASMKSGKKTDKGD
jgi:hypothetical protein